MGRPHPLSAAGAAPTKPTNNTHNSTGQANKLTKQKRKANEKATALMQQQPHSSADSHTGIRAQHWFWSDSGQALTIHAWFVDHIPSPYSIAMFPCSIFAGAAHCVLSSARLLPEQRIEEASRHWQVPRARRKCPRRGASSERCQPCAANQDAASASRAHGKHPPSLQGPVLLVHPELLGFALTP